jgi:hypothetical protein
LITLLSQVAVVAAVVRPHFVKAVVVVQEDTKLQLAYLAV